MIQFVIGKLNLRECYSVPVLETIKTSSLQCFRTGCHAFTNAYVCCRVVLIPIPSAHCKKQERPALEASVLECTRSRMLKKRPALEALVLEATRPRMLKCGEHCFHSESNIRNVQASLRQYCNVRSHECLSVLSTLFPAYRKVQPKEHPYCSPL